MVTRKINQISQLITERSSRTKILYLKDKLNDVFRETEIINEEMISMSDETDPGWMKDVTFNVDTCNSDVQVYIDSRKDDLLSDNRSIRSWIERCQSENGKGDIEKQRNENKYVEHVQENLSDLVNRLNGLTLQGTEQEEKDLHRDNNCPPELKSQWYLHREKTEVSGFSKTELQIKRVTEVTEKQINKRKSLPLIINQIYPNILRNSSVANTIDQFPKAHHTHNYRNPNTWGIPQSYPTDADKTKTFINLPNISSRSQEYMLDQDKTVDSWIDELDSCETSNLNTIVPSQDLKMAWLLQQNLPCIQIPLFNGSPFKSVEFVTNVKDIVHDQGYLNNSQKLHYLQQRVTGDSRRATHGLSTNK